MRDMKRELLIMIASVVVLDAVVIAIYYAIGITTAPRRTQTIFVAVWTVLTLLLVLRGTGRVRAARIRGRTQPRGPRG
jgi:hypothetical protein